MRLQSRMLTGAIIGAVLTVVGCTGDIAGNSGTPAAVGGAGMNVAGAGSGGAVATELALDGGRTVLRRLNRAQYNNTVRDLLGTALRPADHFAPDEVSEGFDTVGAYLAFSPLRAEQLEAATQQLVDELFARPATDPARLATLSCELTPGSEATCARQILEHFAGRAFRRPAAPELIDKLMELLDAARTGGSYEDGLKAALSGMLLSPRFLYLIERDTAKGLPTLQPVDDYELASRLAYFLWSSMPDDALMVAAQAGRLLADASELSAQVSRLLSDPKASALTSEFAGQWLKLRRLSGPLNVDPATFPGYRDELRLSAAEETSRFFDTLVHDDLPVDQLLTADFSVLDQRLAEHYGLPATAGSGFARVSLAGTQRSGILTQASVLLGTSLPNRTSPVKRGVWVLDQLLCQTPPPPPANLDIGELQQAPPGSSIRQVLEAHRSKPECAGCHALMDPIGFGLENFDAIGAYREQDNGAVIDASGKYSDGASFTGARELATKLAADPQFFACVTSHLLTYAVGRSFHTTAGASYAAALAQKNLTAGTHTWRTWLSAVATSDAFKTRRGQELP